MNEGSHLEALREENRRLGVEVTQAAQLLALSGDFVLLIDKTGKIEFINRVDSPRTVSGVVGTPGFDYLVPEHREQTQEAIGKAFAGENVEDFLVQEVDSPNRWFQIHLAPFREDGEVTKVLAVAKDDSARCIAEAALQTANEELEDRVDERTTELRTINQLLRDQRLRLRALLEMQDRDRQLIAFEIHDGLVQDMTSAGMYLAASEDAPNPQKQAADLATAAKLIQNGIAEARRLIMGLRPPILEGEGLAAAIDSIQDEFASLHDMKVEIRWDENINRLAPALETAIYRAVQESLTNVRKHSGVNAAEVSVQTIPPPQVDVEDSFEAKQWIEVTIRDQGKGFDANEISRTTHGLAGLRERARVLGGQTSIFSEPGAGVTVQMKVPAIEAIR